MAQDRQKISEVIAAIPVGHYYVLAYPKGPSAVNLLVQPVGRSAIPARRVFLDTIAEMNRTSTHAHRGVHLMQVRGRIGAAAIGQSRGDTAVLQWTAAPNTNFTWPTGPTHYLDCAAADRRRAKPGEQPFFVAADWLPVE